MSLTRPFRPSDIPTGLVGYWKFNQASTGDDAVDSSGSGYTLVASTAGTSEPTYPTNDYWKSGENCGDIEATTEKSYWTIADANCPNLEINGASAKFSVSVWFKPETLTAMPLISKASYTGNGWRVYTGATGAIGISIEGSSYGSSAGIVSAGKWSHLAFTYDKTDGGRYNVYAEGNLVLTGTTANTITDTNQPVNVGRAQDGSEQGDGSFKDLAVWNTVLTPLQIKSLALGVDLSKYAYRPSNVSTQPTHWWRLNEVSGNRADSISTGAITLSDNNSVLSSGGYIEGVGADFEQDNSEYLSCSSSADVQFSGDFSISVWFKLETRPANGNHYIICGKYQDGNNFYFLSLYNDNSSTNLMPHLFGNTGGNNFNSSCTVGCVAGVWYHLVVRRSGTTVAFYFDGSVPSVNTPTNAQNLSPTGDFKVGHDLGGSASGWKYFDGVISDLSIWKGYVVTEAEAKSLACALPIQRQGIVSYWKMDEASGNAVDSIGSNTGVETGGTIASTTGKVGTARDFVDGDTEYFLASNSDSLDIVSDLSIIGWLKVNHDGAAYQIVDKDYNGDGYGIRRTTTNKIIFYNSSNYSESTTSITAAGSWAHFGGVYTGATREMFFNGVREDSDADTTNPADTTTNLAIGSKVSEADYLDGAIDELVLAKRYFRPEEIKAVYLKGLNGKEVTTSERLPSSSKVMWLY